jgi:hypothetical protein
MSRTPLKTLDWITRHVKGETPLFPPERTKGGPRLPLLRERRTFDNARILRTCIKYATPQGSIPQSLDIMTGRARSYGLWPRQRKMTVDDVITLGILIYARAEAARDQKEVTIEPRREHYEEAQRALEEYLRTNNQSD